ncbi:MAG: IS4 family transposase, partial [Planctomycetes bacterium]|nr:IS4 family transposase [Planctomycetota bacterium]MBI2808933.1 IS4 family transposase [Planctomycetota bacterium]
EILQILSITLFEKTQLFTMLNALGEQKEKTPSHKQLTLFDI